MFNQITTQQTSGQVELQHTKSIHILHTGRVGGLIGAQQLIFALGPPSRLIGHI